MQNALVWLVLKLKIGVIQKFITRLSRIHWGWLVFGFILGWPIEFFENTLMSAFHLLIPMVGPQVVDSIMGPVNDFFFNFVPFTSAGELLRRWGFNTPEQQIQKKNEK